MEKLHKTSLLFFAHGVELACVVSIRHYSDGLQDNADDGKYFIVHSADKLQSDCTWNTVRKIQPAHECCDEGAPDLFRRNCVDVAHVEDTRHNEFSQDARYYDYNDCSVDVKVGFQVDVGEEIHE